MALITGNTGNINTSKTDFTLASSSNSKRKEPEDILNTSDKIDIDNDNDSNNKNSLASFELKKTIYIS